MRAGMHVRTNRARMDDGEIFQVMRGGTEGIHSKQRKIAMQETKENISNDNDRRKREATNEKSIEETKTFIQGLLFACLFNVIV